MAIQSQPSRISEPFAGSGTKNVIPATNTTPSASQAASWASGFPPECSQPISAGGCPVPRNDVNGVLNWLSQGFAFRQDGGIWEWSALADYDVQRMVHGSDGLLYYSVAQSGPDVAAGAVDPTTDDGTYWTSPKIKTLPDATDSSNAAASTAWVNAWGASRIVPEILYLDAANGDDANDGFSAATAKKTFAGVYAVFTSSGYFYRYNHTLNVASGTYSEDFVHKLPFVLTVNFATGSIVSGGADKTFSASGGAVLTVSGNLILNGVHISSTGKSSVYIEDCDVTFNNVSGTAMVQAYALSYVRLYQSSLNFNSCTVSVGTIASRISSAVLIDSGVTFSGTVSGRRYSSYVNSCINGAGSETAIPGSTNGITEASSFYA